MSNAASTNGKHAGNREWWITARAIVNAGAPRGRHGIYRATVTRPHCIVEPRRRAITRRIRRTMRGTFRTGYHAAPAIS